MDSAFWHRLLGAMPIKDFFDHYWQQRPLFVKAAVDPSALRMSTTELRQLATLEDVESRWVTHINGRWAVEHGPFTRNRRGRGHWSLLVQGTNLHHKVAACLFDRFRCLPLLRLDDVMISLANQGGGVGPHVDAYDVFLIQGQGRRRWRISTQSNLRCQPGLPLKQLAQFYPEHEFECTPGDLLYLPPYVAHEGVALQSADDDVVSWVAIPRPECARGRFVRRASRCPRSSFVCRQSAQACPATRTPARYVVTVI